MAETWALAALWLGLALIATLVSIWLRVATALSEIVVGTIAQLFIGALLGAAVLGGDEGWIKFLSGTGAIVLTFLAGAELDPEVFRRKWKEATAVGLISFFAPFFGCAAVARWLLGWSPVASWLAGIAMSTTSVAVVYAVMLEFGFNTTDYGKTVLAACFVTDLGTVVALGLIFAPFTLKTVLFVAALAALAFILPWLTPRFFRRYGGRPSEIEAKYLLLCLFGLGALAAWADSEAVLPAYLIGMVLAGTMGRDHALVRRLRAADAVLLHSRRLVRFRPGAGRRSRCFRAVPDRQDSDEDRRRLSGDARIPVAAERRHLHDIAHVHGPDIRHEPRASRPRRWPTCSSPP